MLSWGWRRAVIAFVAGAVSTLALAPFNAWPVLFVTFPVAVWLLEGSSAGRLGGVLTAAITGWWFGFGYFVAGLYWIGFAFLVDAKTFAWLLPFAVIGLPVCLAVYTALGFALARLLWMRGPLRIVALALALTATEWLRGHLLTGFPWNTIRLCADRTARPRAGLRADRHLGADVLRRHPVREPGRSGRRARRHAPALLGAAARALRPCGVRRVWGDPARADADAARCRREAAHHAAEPDAGREVQLRRQAIGHAAAISRCPIARPGPARRACAT